MVCVSHSVVSNSNPMDCSPWVSLSIGFYRQEYWSALPFTSLEDLPDPGIEPWSPALQADSLPTEPLRKPRHAWLPHYQHLHQSVIFVSVEPSGTYHNHSESVAQHVMVHSWCCPVHKLGQMYQHAYIMIETVFFTAPSLSVPLLLRRHFL